MSQSVNKPVRQPVSQLASKSAGQPASQSVSQSVSQSLASFPISQSVSQPVSQPVSQSVSQSVNQSVCQSTSQWTCQSASQSASHQSVTQYTLVSQQKPCHIKMTYWPVSVNISRTKLFSKIHQVTSDSITNEGSQTNLATCHLFPVAMMFTTSATPLYCWRYFWTSEDLSQTLFKTINLWYSLLPEKRK